MRLVYALALAHPSHRTRPRTLAARLAALPSGALLLVSDQARYVRCQQGFALLLQLLEARGARLVISRTTPRERHERGNRFTLPPRLQGVYGQPAGPDGPKTNHYRIYNRQLQLAAVLG